MSELSQHIEALLLTHDCVVIPQLGAFVTQWIEASRADDEALLFPPQRSLRFNTSITTDDGLLVHSIRHTYRMAEADAKRKVQTLVLDLRQQLLADGQADFGALGQFTQDEDGVVAFESCSAGTVTPSYYGLDTIVFPRLQTAAKARSNRLGNVQEHRSSLFHISSTGGDIEVNFNPQITIQGNADSGTVSQMGDMLSKLKAELMREVRREFGNMKADFEHQERRRSYAT